MRRIVVVGRCGFNRREPTLHPGVHTAIVGTDRPGRWQENARILAEGPLPEAIASAIRARWRAVARPDWGGQT